MKQYQVWVMITLLAAIAGVLVYSNTKKGQPKKLLPMQEVQPADVVE